jgi:hypothetical protein
LCQKWKNFLLSLELQQIRDLFLKVLLRIELFGQEQHEKLWENWKIFYGFVHINARNTRLASHKQIGRNLIERSTEKSIEIKGTWEIFKWKIPLRIFYRSFDHANSADKVSIYSFSWNSKSRCVLWQGSNEISALRHCTATRLHSKPTSQISSFLFWMFWSKSWECQEKISINLDC